MGVNKWVAIGVFALLAFVIVFMYILPPNGNYDVEITHSRSYWVASQPVSILDVFFYSKNTTGSLNVMNNGNTTLTVTNISVGNGALSSQVILKPGESRLVQISNAPTGECGSKYVYLIAITYGMENTNMPRIEESNARPLIGKYLC